MPHTLLISDLHLAPDRPEVSCFFFDFLEKTASRAEALYVLGDLFEYWPGDDELATPLPAAVAKAFTGLRQNGVALYLMHGNRDFLLGERFLRASGATLLSDPTLTNLYGTPTLLLHGDTLCTDDTAYLAFRAKVRDPAWQSEFLALPLPQRKAIIEGLRRDNALEKGQKSAAAMDVNLDAVSAVLRQYHYPRLIHGHTHRPALHVHNIDGRRCERWVLGDWYEHGSGLRCDSSGCRAIAW